MAMDGLEGQKLAALNTDEVTELLTCRRERRGHSVVGAVPGNGMLVFGRVSCILGFAWRGGVKKRNTSQDENGGVWNRKKEQRR